MLHNDLFTIVLLVLGLAAIYAFSRPRTVEVEKVVEKVVYRTPWQEAVYFEGAHIENGVLYYKLNSVVVKHDHLNNRWIQHRSVDGLSDREKWVAIVDDDKFHARLEPHSMVRIAALTGAVAVQTPKQQQQLPVQSAAGTPRQMYNKEAESHISKNTLFTDAEKDAVLLPNKYQWVYAAGDWAIERK